MTTASLLPSTAKPFLNMERLQAVLFPHWVLWLVPNVVLALCMIMAAASSRIEFIHFGYNVFYTSLFVVLVLMIWRYARFNTFDWFLHACGVSCYWNYGSRIQPTAFHYYPLCFLLSTFLPSIIHWPSQIMRWVLSGIPTPT